MPSTNTNTNTNTNLLTQQILNFLFSRRAFAWRNNTAGIFDPVRRIYRTSPKRGVSDILACYKGHFLAIEVKSPADRLSEDQESFLSNVASAGGHSFVVRDLDTFVEEFSRVFPSSAVDNSTVDNFI